MTDRATAVTVGSMSGTSGQPSGKSSDRKSAIWVGVLWIMATVFPVASISSWIALDDGDGILANAATHKSQLITWALLNLVGRSRPLVWR
jgi:hypothetical protein